MARFLFTSLPVEGHSASPLAIMSRLAADGHHVVWVAGARYADQASRVGVTHVPVWLSTDFSRYDDVFDVFPELRPLRGVALLKAAFRDLFLADAGPQAAELEAVLTDFPADVIVASGPQFGPLLAAARTGTALAWIGDGPLATLDDEAPPFGPGLRPWPGPPGRARNRALNLIVRQVFADVHERWVDVRQAHSLGGPHPWVFDAFGTADLVLQGCVAAFEYRRTFPTSVRFVGAHRPVPPAGWHEPGWWGELDDGRPVVHVTQGTIRPDPAELVRPVIDALADDDVHVVATTGAIDPATLGPLPSNVRHAPFVPYERLLAKADAFVTNGGYIGTNLALHHGVPVVQVGATEEKAETGARLDHLCFGVAFKRVPSRRRLRGAIHRALGDELLRSRVRWLADEYQRHDSVAESCDLLVALAAGDRPLATGQDLATTAAV